MNIKDVKIKKTQDLTEKEQKDLVKLDTIAKNNGLILLGLSLDSKSVFLQNPQDLVQERIREMPNVFNGG
jgi:hypothetical protein